MPLLSDDHRRKRNLIIVAGFLVLVGAANLLDVGVYAPDLPLASNIAVFALLNLNLIVLLLLVLLLFRNLVKLWFERREQVIGAKFKAKLVMSFLTLSLVPSMLIFLIASNFITKSIEGWFKPQVERPLDQALAVAQTYYANLERTALRHAQHIGRVIDRDGLLAESRREALAAYLVEQQDRLGISAITVFGAQGQELVHVSDLILGDLATRDVDENQLRQGIAGQELTTVRELVSGDLVEAVVPIWVTKGERRVVGVVVVGTHVTDRLEARVRAISQSFREFKQLKLLKAPIKGIYILLFLLMTLIVVFSFTWFGLYLARGITGPIEQLAEGTREVAAGNLAYKVPTHGDDEIGVLVQSFNRMTDDLGKSKRQLEEAYLDLIGQAHRARGPPRLHRDRPRGHHHRRGLLRPARAPHDHQPRRRPHARRQRVDRRRALPRGRLRGPRAPDRGRAGAPDAAAPGRQHRARVPAAPGRRHARCSPPRRRCAAPTASTLGPSWFSMT